MKEYLSRNGWHFSKKMAEWAIGKMKDTNGQKVSMIDKATIDSLLVQFGQKPENDSGYDAVYVWHMLKSDFGDLVTPDDRLAKFVKRYLDDKDGYKGIAFTRFYADCIGKGCAIEWEDVL